MKSGHFVGEFLDEGEAKFIAHIGLPELFVVVEFIMERWVDEFLNEILHTPFSSI